MGTATLAKSKGTPAALRRMSCSQNTAECTPLKESLTSLDITSTPLKEGEKNAKRPSAEENSENLSNFSPVPEPLHRQPLRTTRQSVLRSQAQNFVYEKFVFSKFGYA